MKKQYQIIMKKNYHLDKILKKAIKTCLKRSALSLNWDKGTIC